MLADWRRWRPVAEAEPERKSIPAPEAKPSNGPKCCCIAGESRYQCRNDGSEEAYVG